MWRNKLPALRQHRDEHAGIVQNGARLIIQFNCDGSVGSETRKRKEPVEKGKRGGRKMDSFVLRRKRNVSVLISVRGSDLDGLHLNGRSVAVTGVGWRFNQAMESGWSQRPQSDDSF